MSLVRAELDAKINAIAFPQVVHDLAKDQPGFSIFDAGLLYADEKFYFTEFCGMRPGWCGFLSEIVMRDEGGPYVAPYFEDCVAGKNPIVNKYGVYVRMFHYDADNTEAKIPKAGVPMFWDPSINNNLFLYNAKKVGSLIETAMSEMDFVATLTGADNDLQLAVTKTYNRISKFYFEKVYYRHKGDFLDRCYPSSIPNRLDAVLDYL